MRINVTEVLLMISVMFPLFLTFLLTFRVTRPLGMTLSPWAALPVMVAGFFLTPSEMQGQFPGLLLGGELALDAHGRVFLELAALVWILAGSYARSFFSQPEQRLRFYLLYLLAMTGNFVLTLSQDILTLYLGSALMSFAYYGLVIFNGSDSAFRAGRIYIILLVVSELILFEALLLAAQTADSLALDTVRVKLASAEGRDFIMLLVLIGFGVKASLLILHVWLPLAAQCAPTPAGTVAVGTMINAGLLGWMRLLPLGETPMPEWSLSLMILGFIAVIYGALVGLTQREPKTLVAYAVVSQVGLVTMITGLGMLVPQAQPAILWVLSLLALHNGLNNSALLMGVGFCNHHNRMPRRWLWAGLWLPALAVAGAPLTGAMLARDLLADPIRLTPAPWTTLLPIALFFSYVALGLLMLRLMYMVRPDARPLSESPTAGLTRTWVIAVAIGLLMPWWLASALPELIILHIKNSIWPLLVAIISAFLVVRTGIIRRVPSVPAGDVLFLMELAARWLMRLYGPVAGIGRIYNNMQRIFYSRLEQMISSVLSKLK